jgi:hypothetical protein
MLNLTLGLILAGCAIAVINWRWGVAAAIVVGLAQDPLRKLIPGTPALLAMASVPVWLTVLASAAYAHQLNVRRFFSQFPRLAWWMRSFALYLVIPAAISATWGAGTWKITLLGLIVYSATFLAMVAGWRYARRPEDVGRLLGFYALVASLFLIGGPLDSLGWGERFPAIGSAAMGHIWVTYRTGAPVYMLSGFFRGPDVMGWHASLVFMVSVVMALRSKGAARWLWMALAVWGVLNIWLCGRRKMLAMLPVFAGGYVFLVCWFKNIRRIAAIAATVLLIGGLGWYFISSLFHDEAVERFYMTTLTEAEDRAYLHGFRSIFPASGWTGPACPSPIRPPTKRWRACCGRRRGSCCSGPRRGFGTRRAARCCACSARRSGKTSRSCRPSQIWAPWNLALGDCATVGHGVDLYAVDRIEIGAHATVSQRAFLCTATHDVDHPNMPLKPRRSGSAPARGSAPRPMSIPAWKSAWTPWPACAPSCCTTCRRDRSWAGIPRSSCGCAILEKAG